MLKKNCSLLKKMTLIALLTMCAAFETQDSHIIKAQQVEEDKCNQVYQKAEKTYKECFGVELIDTLAPQLVNEFGITSLEDEWARLDGLLSQLRNDQQSVGYIVVYGGRVNKYGELKERPKTLKAYIKTKLSNSDRVKFVEGGFREKFGYELWISQSEKMFPPLSPTVDPEKVIFRGKMKPLPTDLYN